MALVCDKIVRLDVIYDRKGLQTSDFLRVFPSNEANSRRSLVRDTMISAMEEILFIFKKNFKIQKFPPRRGWTLNLVRSQTWTKLDHRVQLDIYGLHKTSHFPLQGVETS